MEAFVLLDVHNSNEIVYQEWKKLMHVKDPLLGEQEIR